MVHSFPPMASGPETTGRYLVLLQEDAIDAGVQLLSQTTRANISRSAEAAPDGSVLLPTLGVAIVEAEPAQMGSLEMGPQSSSPILATEPEQVMYAIEAPLDVPRPVLPDSRLPEMPIEYLRGYRDAVNHLVAHFLPGEPASTVQAVVDESQTTWGLQATRVVNSFASGRGMKLAVLDTGFDLTHPDFAERTVNSKSFIAGEEVQDGNGHGTHCIGTACGSRQPTRLPRYGIAYNAEIYAGKVLSNRGRGPDGGILQGIEWAIVNGCQVISLSLGAPTQVGDRFSPIYEEVARRALRQGTVIIAAAGNDSSRPGIIRPVSRPANSPSIVAVAALDSDLQIARFSNRGVNPDGGQVDIAAPGVAVYSSWPLPTQYRTIDGTSMATPHVAGIAALYAEQTGARGQELWNLLMRTARRLPLPSADVGAGIVQAP